MSNEWERAERRRDASRETIRMRIGRQESLIRHSLLIAHCSLLLTLAACGAGAPPATLAPAPTATPAPTPISTAAPWLRQPPAPLTLPADEAPHDNLTEWWYYTGHLQAAGGERYGFEFVIFQVRFGDAGPTYLSHFAVTDLNRRQFAFDQRSGVGARPQPAGGGFDLAIGDWSMAGRDGRDRLKAGMDRYGVDLSLSAVKPAALHLGTGYISFGAAGDSYYYSRTRLTVQGTLTDHGVAKPVTGTAWFDKQWGDFISVKGSGWDWYALQLDDGAEIMIFDVRSPNGQRAILYGSYVDAAGGVTDIRPDEMSVEATGEWRSPHSGATYPSGWRVRLPQQRLDLVVSPLLDDQELDTGATTGLFYWEGAVGISGTRAGRPVGGRGYVELTGYAR
jgi:predicted secreted hydrolase